MQSFESLAFISNASRSANALGPALLDTWHYSEGINCRLKRKVVHKPLALGQTCRKVSTVKFKFARGI